jgi:hypothetical protein
MSHSSNPMSPFVKLVGNTSTTFVFGDFGLQFKILKFSPVKTLLTATSACSRAQSTAHPRVARCCPRAQTSSPPRTPLGRQGKRLSQGVCPTPSPLDERLPHVPSAEPRAGPLPCTLPPGLVPRAVLPGPSISLGV